MALVTLLMDLAIRVTSIFPWHVRCRYERKKIPHFYSSLVLEETEIYDIWLPVIRWYHSTQKKHTLHFLQYFFSSFFNYRALFLSFTSCLLYFFRISSWKSEKKNLKAFCSMFATQLATTQKIKIIKLCEEKRKCERYQGKDNSFVKRGGGV